ncbi:TonB-like [hydrothermal vent metagenome]|uniref:TonB-like n=1 Tax=hydrothermal vent metagenome TaxID=652676 RepID=A0A3B0XJG0_9ZZZZ
MSIFRINTWDEPFLPWVQSANDRRFLRILLISIVVFSVFGAIVPFLPTPEPVKKDLKTVSPRLAELIMEKRKLPPPPPPKPVKPKAKPKPKPSPKEKKKPEKKKPAKKPAKKPVKQKKPPKKQKPVKQSAASRDLMLMADDLGDLRDSFDLTEIEDTTLSKTGKTKTQNFGGSPVITSSATAMKSSGGIKSSRLSSSTGGGRLATRRTTKVSSNINTGPSAKPIRKGKSGRAIRPEYEIEQVFQKNKSAIYAIYNRALRKDPSLQGKVVIELTIAPDGKVIKARILSSDLNNPRLEKRLIARVKLFRFKPGNSEKVTVKYPIDFLPS